MTTDPLAVAAEITTMLRDGRFDELQRRFAPVLASAVSPDTVRSGWAGQLAKTGQIVAFGPATTTRMDAALTLIVVPVQCVNGDFEVRFSVDSADLLHGLRLAPSESSWTPPRYAKAQRFTEEEITLDCGALTVTGTLTVPRGAREVPGIVLIASGASDRDVTVGPNKPFKDLAWGLASRGIAVVRFDKVTQVHSRLEHEAGFTMVQEYLPNAIAAVRLLQQHPRVNATRVFVAGISGGGKAAVRVAAADPSVAGVVALAADTVPLPRAAGRTFEHVAAMEPAAIPDGALEGSAAAIARTEDPALSPQHSGGDLLFGWPASYWLDLRDFDQVATAASLGRPILILQGGRDYQVTKAEDLAGWRAGLQGTPHVTIRVFPADDHMFFPGRGPSRPSDYQRPNHLDRAVVSSIARWVRRR